jgi:hypothetical protein
MEQQRIQSAAKVRKKISNFSQEEITGVRIPGQGEQDSGVNAKTIPG